MGIPTKLRTTYTHTYTYTFALGTSKKKRIVERRTSVEFHR